MKIGGKEINDECSKCGNVLECDLFLAGHGIKTERSRISEMVQCQLKHQTQREEKNEG